MILKINDLSILIEVNDVSHHASLSHDLILGKFEGGLQVEVILQMLEMWFQSLDIGFYLLTGEDPERVFHGL